MKKLFYLFSIFSVILVLSACSEEKAEIKKETSKEVVQKNIKVSNSHADFAIIYPNLTTLKDMPDYVIEVKFTGETVNTVP